MNITDITIDPEFQNLIRPLAEKEREELRASLSRCGLLSPLIVWKTEGKTILVDGHNRLALWKELDGFDGSGGHEIRTQEIFLGVRGIAKEWIIKNQLGRRNLSPADYKLLVGQLYNQRKTTQGGDKKSKGKTCTLINTAEQIASETGVSPRTVKSAGKLAAKVEEIEAAQPEAPRAEVITEAKEQIRRVKVTMVVPPLHTYRVLVTTPAAPKSHAEILEETKVAMREAEEDSPKLRKLKRAWMGAGDLDAEAFTTFAAGMASPELLRRWADCVIEATPADMLQRLLERVQFEVERRGEPQ